MQNLDATTRQNPPGGIDVPKYSRQDVSTGIVHFGVGGFHRAHQAMYLDRLMNEGRDLDFGICGVGVLPGDRRMKEILEAQDFLYSLVLKHPNGSLEGRIIGSIVEYLFAPEDPEAVLDKLADPAIRIVSLTVTEGGYNIDHVTGEFNVAEPAVAADLTAKEPPRTVFGFIVEGLRRRRARGIPPFTVMSCDNIEGNGEVAERVISGYAEAKDPELGAWVRDNVSFPNSMVDRITPVTTDADREAIGREFELADAWPVVCEPFEQWVLEDAFTLGRPAYEEVGVQVVEDVGPYELMKLRLLNASHQGQCYFGYLHGYRYAHEVCQDPAFAEFLLAYMREEAQPTLPPVPGIDLHEYQDTLIERFSNAYVRDTLARLCAESSDRIPKWLLPVIRENLRTGGPIERSAGIVASWARYDEGVDEAGEKIEIVDRLAAPLHQAALRQHDEPLAFVSNREVFGDLVGDERFTTAYLAALNGLHERGAKATVESLT